jgi:AcrR family transcriptional regulator
MSSTSADIRPVEARRNRQREETRQVILGAASALLAEGGQEFSIRALTERCGYTAPTVYHYFRDKEGLMNALVDRGFEELSRQLEALPEQRDPLERQRSITRTWLLFARNNAALYRQLFSPIRVQRDESSPAVERARALMSAPMDELARSGRLQMSDPEAARLLMFALTHGLTTLSTLRPEFEWSDEGLEEAIDVVLRGIVAPGKPNVELSPKQIGEEESP